MSLALYFVVLALAAVVAGLTRLAAFRRGLADRCCVGCSGYLARARSVAASTLLRPAAAAVLLVTGVWLAGALAAAILRVGVSSWVGPVSVPILIGGGALDVLVFVAPRPLTGPLVGGPPGVPSQDDVGPARPTGESRPVRSRLSLFDFERWEQELRDDHRGNGSEQNL